MAARSPRLPAQEHLLLVLWGGAGLGWGEKHCTHKLAFPPLQGCFFLVTSTMESKMSVVAGISFGIACFQVTLPFWPARGERRGKLVCLRRYLISVQSLVCVQKARPVSAREEQLFCRFPLGLISPLSFQSLKARAEAPALFP